MARHPDKVKLLFGPYTPPPLRKGDRATCLYRDCDVVVTGWSDGRIPWPRCRSLEARGGAGGILVEEELARGVRGESATALAYWWGVSMIMAWRWRKALGVEGWTATEGTRRLMRATAEKAVAQVRGKPLSPEQVEQRRQTTLELNLAQYLDPAHGAGWSEDELALLGTVPDEEVARRTGRTVNAIQLKRGKLGIPDPDGHAWTEEEMALLGTSPDEEVAAKIGRTPWAVICKRCKLGVPTFRDRRFREGRP
jgi:hypothetical protein